MQRSRKTLLITLAAAAFLFINIANSNAGEFRRRYSISSREKLPWEEFQPIDIVELSGDINISGVQCNITKINSGSVADSEKYCSTIQLKRIRTCYSDTLNNSRTRAGAISADIDNRRGAYIMRETLPADWPPGVAGKTDYIITSPASAPLALQTVSGDITLSGMKNTIAATAANGNITVNNATSTLALKTITGDITLNGSPASATLNTVTGAANIKISALDNATLNINTLTGPVRIEIPEDLDAAITATTALGRIDAENTGLQNQKTAHTTFTAGDSASKNKINISTYTGNITITNPAKDKGTKK